MHSSDDRFTRFLLQMIRFGRFLYRFFEALAGTGHCSASHQVALAWHWALSASLQAGTGHCGAGREAALVLHWALQCPVQADTGKALASQRQVLKDTGHRSAK